jgi:hypothetical protein
MKLGWMQYFKLLIGGKPVLEELIKQGYDAKAAASTSGVKSLAFWMVTLSGLGAVLAQAGHIIPPPYGAIIMAASAALYTIAKGLQKKDDPLGGVKPTIATSEFWVNALSAVSALLTSVGGVTTPETAAILVAIATGSVAVGDSLAKSGARPGDAKP